MLNVGLIFGSTRPNRFANKPIQWIVDGASARRDIKVSIPDLSGAPLPFFSGSTAFTHCGGGMTEHKAVAWRHSIGRFDAFIAVVPEYNHGPTAVIKHALDALVEWRRKPIAFVGYGSFVGATRAIEAMRGMATWLQMAPIYPEVNIPWEPFLAVLQKGRSLNDFHHLVRSRDRMFDHLVWWGEALKAGRQCQAAKHPEAA